MDPNTAESEGVIWERLQKSREEALSKCWTACQNSDTSQIKDLFTSLGNQNVDMLLQRTVFRNLVEATKCLLEQGADPKDLPLISVVEQCDVAMLQLLANFGIEYRSTEQNMLVYAINRREVLDWLLDQGLDINAGGNRSLKGRDKLYRDNTVAVLNETAAAGDIELFDYLVSRGAKPSQSNALHHAVGCKDAAKGVAMISHLIDTYHLDVNADDSCGGLNELVQYSMHSGSPLYCAVTSSNVAAAGVLLKNGARSGKFGGLAEDSEMKRLLDEWKE